MSNQEIRSGLLARQAELNRDIAALKVNRGALALAAAKGDSGAIERLGKADQAVAAARRELEVVADALVELTRHEGDEALSARADEARVRHEAATAASRDLVAVFSNAEKATRAFASAYRSLLDAEAKLHDEAVRMSRTVASPRTEAAITLKQVASDKIGLIIFDELKLDFDPASITHGNLTPDGYQDDVRKRAQIIEQRLNETLAKALAEAGITNHPTHTMDTQEAA